MEKNTRLRLDDLGTGAGRFNHHRWAVIDLRWSRIMGTVDFSEHGKCYYFMPDGNQGFDADELAEIAEFVKSVNPTV